MTDIEKFKKVNEVHADALEACVKEFREESRLLRRLLGASDERLQIFSKVILEFMYRYFFK